MIYTLLASIPKFMPKVTKALIAGTSLLVNGTLIARVGTALIASLTNSYRVPFILCLETYKFSSKTQLDAFSSNQLRNPHIISTLTHNNLINAINLKWDLTPIKFIDMVLSYQNTPYFYYIHIHYYLHRYLRQTRL